MNVLLFVFIISATCASPQYFYDKPFIPFPPTPKPSIGEIKASNGYNYPKPDVPFTLPDKIILERISTIREPIVTSLRPTNPTIRSVLPTAFVQEGYVYSKPKVEFTFPSAAPIFKASPPYSPVSISTSYATLRPANPPPKSLLRTISTKKEYYYPKPKVEFNSVAPTFTTPLLVTSAPFVTFSPTNPPPKTFVPKTVPKKGYFYPKPKVEFTFPSTVSTFKASSSYSPVITSTPFVTSKPTNPPPKPFLHTTTIKKEYFYPKPKVEFTFPNAAPTLVTLPRITPTPFATVGPTNLPSKLSVTTSPKPAYIQPTFKPTEIFHPPSLQSPTYYPSTHRPTKVISTYVPSTETNLFSRPPSPPPPKPIIEKISSPPSRPTYASKTYHPPSENSVISFSQTTPRPLKAISFAPQTTSYISPTSQLSRISDRSSYIPPLQSTKTSEYFYPKPSIPFTFTPPASLKQSPFTPTSSKIRIVTLTPQISNRLHLTTKSPSVYSTILVPFQSPSAIPEIPLYIPSVPPSTPPPPPSPKPTIEVRIPEQKKTFGYNYAMRQNPPNLPGYHYPKPQIEFPLPTVPNPEPTLPAATYGYHYNAPSIPFNS